MARIRTIKPELLEDEKTAALSLAAYKLFTGLIILSDDHGNGRAAAGFLHAQVFWANEEITRRHVTDALAELAGVGLVQLYEVSGQRYVAVTGWAKHQRIDNAGKPRVPGPDEADPPVSGDPPRETPPAEIRGESPRVSAARRDLPLDPDPDQRTPTQEEEQERAGAREPDRPPDPDPGGQLALAPTGPPEPTPEAVREAWRQICVPAGMRDVRALKKRAAKIRARTRGSYEDFGRALSTLDGWRAYFARLAASSFARGDAGDGRGLDFDFALASDGNVVKVLEGKYDDRTPGRGGGPAPPRGGGNTVHDRIREQKARLLEERRQAAARQRRADEDAVLVETEPGVFAAAQRR